MRRRVVLDSQHVAAIAAGSVFRRLFPGVVVDVRRVSACCGMAAESGNDVKRVLLRMSEAQARLVAAAVGIPAGSDMVVRLVDGRRVDSRTFAV
jgi:hypothetical protein